MPTTQASRRAIARQSVLCKEAATQYERLVERVEEAQDTYDGQIAGATKALELQQTSRYAQLKESALTSLQRLRLLQHQEQALQTQMDVAEKRLKELKDAATRGLPLPQDVVVAEAKRVAHDQAMAVVKERGIGLDKAKTVEAAVFKKLLVQYEDLNKRGRMART